MIFQSIPKYMATFVAIWNPASTNLEISWDHLRSEHQVNPSYFRLPPMPCTTCALWLPMLEKRRRPPRSSVCVAAQQRCSQGSWRPSHGYSVKRTWGHGGFSRFRTNNASHTHMISYDICKYIYVGWSENFKLGKKERPIVHHHFSSSSSSSS